MSAPRVWIVSPCYNEEEALPLTVPVMVGKLRQLLQNGAVGEGSRVLLVDDGSRDATWRIITEFAHTEPLVTGLKLSRNYGHQNALLAGLFEARHHSDYVLTIDADLQDDINVLDDMLERVSEGAEIVYGVRASRATDTAFKRASAQFYYTFMGKALGSDLVYNHADTRLMSARAIDELARYPEVNIFLRGLLPRLGYPSATAEYARTARSAGESKYPLRKMVAFAWQGITSLSTTPLTVIAAIGSFASVVGLGYLVYIFVQFILGHTVAGWASVVGSIWLLGGLQLVALGVVGSYVGKTYLETKSRPRYHVEQLLP